MKILRDMINEDKFRVKCKRVVSCVLFLIILAGGIEKITYLMRRPTNALTNSGRIAGIRQEKDLDMIYVGGSSVYVYWLALNAWNDCGFTSYSYATDSAQAENLKYYIKETLKTQNPELYVVDVRSFLTWADPIHESGLRNGSDSMDLFSLNRLEFITQYLSNRSVTSDTDILSYYLDIVKYHTNTEMLANRDNWDYIMNHEKVVLPNKGWGWQLANEYLERPDDFSTDERAELPDGAMEALMDLLDYCKSEELRVLFVVSPYRTTREDQKKFNTIKDLAEQYEFTFLNANEYYDAMGIDFATDFYNVAHVNYFGAEKYTVFLEEKIEEIYDLPDHRTDPNYDEWNAEYQRFLYEQSIYLKVIEDIILDVEMGKELADEMRKTEDIMKWYLLVSDSRFTLFLTKKGDISKPYSVADTQIMENLDIMNTTINDIRIVNNGSIIETNADDLVTTYELTLADSKEITCYINNTDELASVVIEGNEYSRQEEGINIVVFDNNYGKVVDSITIQTVDGKLQLER